MALARDPRGPLLYHYLSFASSCKPFSASKRWVLPLGAPRRGALGAVKTTFWPDANRPPLPISALVLDSSGSSRHLGTASSDLSRRIRFRIAWK